MLIGRTRLPTRESWARGTEKILAGGELTVLQHNALAAESKISSLRRKLGQEESNTYTN
jgi:hypothetical protein